MNPRRDYLAESRLVRALPKISLKELVKARPYYLRVVDSTQGYAINTLKTKNEGDFVIAEVQTAGRGREGRTWVSDQGGLWLTMVLTPPDSEFLSKLPIMVAISIQGTLERFGLRCAIKLPNDIYCNDKKIAGILIDSTIEGKNSLAYVGVGINVNNGISRNEEIASIATTMASELSHEVDLTIFTVSLIERLDTNYYQLLRAPG